MVGRTSHLSKQKQPELVEGLLLRSQDAILLSLALVGNH